MQSCLTNLKFILTLRYANSSARLKAGLARRSRPNGDRKRFLNARYRTGLNEDGRVANYSILLGPSKKGAQALAKATSLSPIGKIQPLLSCRLRWLQWPG